MLAFVQMEKTQHIGFNPPGNKTALAHERFHPSNFFGATMRRGRTLKELKQLKSEEAEKSPFSSEVPDRRFLALSPRPTSFSSFHLFAVVFKQVLGFFPRLATCRPAYTAQEKQLFGEAALKITISSSSRAERV